MDGTITFIIPTLRRSEHLRRCLKAVGNQALAAHEILVGIKPNDEESRAVVNEFAGKLPVKEVRAEGVGVVGSMDSCLAAATGSYIALLDDDVEIPSHWSATMLEHLLRHAECVAAGGRDILLDYPEMRRAESLINDVGRIHLYGRITGSHHRAGGQPRPVDVLRGSNILFRAAFLRERGFEKSLRGTGAQVHWEIALALQALASDRRMFFDPSVQVLHHVAPRHDEDTVHRGVFSARGTEDMSFNETFVVLLHARGLRKATVLLWQLFVGNPACPGALRLAEVFTAKRPMLLLKVSATFKGRLAALRQWLSRIL
jgi:glycosyltransferase involved in cell wall biosynthesis